MTTPAATTQPSPRRTTPRPAAFLRGFDNLKREHGFEPLKVEGAIPADLEGTLYRNGAGLMERFGERYPHWFDADGAVSAVRFRGGAAFGAARIVQTPGLLREQQAGRRLYGGFNTPLARPFRELILGERKNPANTAVLMWQKRLFALCEAGLPVELSPDDLTTVGETNLGDEVLSTFSAHPHDVPARRALYNFGLRLGRTTSVDIVELPYRGRARRLGSFSLKGARVVHDFMVTDRHAVFLFSPFFLRLLPLLVLGGGAVDRGLWRGDLPTEVIVVPLDDPTSVRRFDAPAFLHSHTVNAFERKGSIVFDYTHLENMNALERFVGKVGSGSVREPLGTSVRRGVIDLAKKTVRFEERLARHLDLPRVSPRVDTRPYRFAYFTGHSSEEASCRTMFDVMIKADIETGRMQTFRFGPDQFPSEAVFVPRRGGTAEDDGYLLTLVYDAPTHTSHVAVLDARDPARPPLSRAHFDHAIPFGFHGSWIGAA